MPEAGASGNCAADTAASKTQLPTGVTGRREQNRKAKRKEMPRQGNLRCTYLHAAG
jgi:hypothetical protein